MSPLEQSLLDAALRYGAKGWRVFPCERSGKKPLTPDGYKDATTDEMIIKNWWSTAFKGANIGIACDGQFWALDIDGEKGRATLAELQKQHGRLPETLRQETGNGEHWLFKHDGCNIKNAAGILPGIDTRSDGYIIAAPSVHSTGKEYRFFSDPEHTQIVGAPDWLLKIVSKPATTDLLFNDSSISSTTPYGRAALAGEVERVLSASEGKRNDILNCAAFKVGQLAFAGQIDELEGRDTLAAAASEIGLDRREIKSTIKSGIRGGSSKPRVAGAPTGEKDEPWPEPVDPFGDLLAPPLCRGAFPNAIEDFAFDRAALLGADPGGIAMAALTAFAAAISDEIAVQVKEHDKHWKESARIWSVLVGAPSTKKTPAIKLGVAQLESMDKLSIQKWAEKKEELLAEDPSGKSVADLPPPGRITVSDTTIEALQEILINNPSGVLSIRDELAGWFGSMEKYTNGKGSAVDRAFWLQAWNGGGYTVDRVVRGNKRIPNLSASIIGGVQPDVLARDIAGMQDDGLLQRFLPVCLGPATVGEDRPSNREFNQNFLTSLIKVNQLGAHPDGASVLFSPEAQEIRRLFEKEALQLSKLEEAGCKFQAWAGKLDAQFARTALIFTCIEYVGNYLQTVVPPDVISLRAAEMTDKLFREFLIPHALRFYCSILERGSTLEHARSIAGLILAHQPRRITRSWLSQNYRPAKNHPKLERVEPWLDILVGFGWLRSQNKGSRATAWEINPRVFHLFYERAEREKLERAARQATLKNIFNEK